MTYEQLDFIADSYIPALFIYFLLANVRQILRVERVLVCGNLVVITLGVVVTYALMFVDSWLNLWPRFDLDYSTHTALALVFVTFIAFQNKLACLVAMSSMLAYVALMLYQQYHSLLDIITTTVAVLPLFIWTNARFRLIND